MSATPPQHTLSRFDVELQNLRQKLIAMGDIVQNELALATQAITERDPEAATRAMREDPRVDALEREAEQQVIRMLALRQPMADDLRLIVATLKITGDLERMGDYAKNVAKRAIVLARHTLPFPLTNIATMARLVQQEVKLVTEAIGARDPVRSERVWYDDQQVDDLYTSIFRELITYMMEDAHNITPCTHLLFIAKNLERIGDHATNIAETVYYAATGETLPETRPKGAGSTGL